MTKGGFVLNFEDDCTFRQKVSKHVAFRLTTYPEEFQARADEIVDQVYDQWLQTREQLRREGKRFSVQFVSRSRMIDLFRKWKREVKAREYLGQHREDSFEGLFDREEALLIGLALDVGFVEKTPALWWGLLFLEYKQRQNQATFDQFLRTYVPKGIQDKVRQNALGEIEACVDSLGPILPIRPLVLLQMANSLLSYPSCRFDWQLHELVHDCIYRILEDEALRERLKSLSGEYTHLPEDVATALKERIESYLFPILKKFEKEDANTPTQEDLPESWRPLLERASHPNQYVQSYLHLVSLEQEIRHARLWHEKKNAKEQKRARQKAGSDEELIEGVRLASRGSLAESPIRYKSKRELAQGLLHQPDLLRLFWGLLAEFADAPPPLSEWYPGISLPNWCEDLVHALDGHDFYSRAHSARVSYFSYLFHHFLGAQKELAKWRAEIEVAYGVCWESYVQHSVLGAFLHDIGKLFVPRRYLLKPGRLTDEEFRWIKRHTYDGQWLLKCQLEMESGAIEEPQRQIMDEAVATHHEAWDGSGYHQGRKQGNIPLVGQLLSIVDSYEAMMSRRPYRAAMSDREVEKKMWEETQAGGLKHCETLLKLFWSHRNKLSVQTEQGANLS